jgi:hypothetical protein
VDTRGRFGGVFVPVAFTFVGVIIPLWIMGLLANVPLALVEACRS